MEEEVLEEQEEEEVVVVEVEVEVEEGLTQVMEPLADDSETKMSSNTIPTFTSGMHDVTFYALIITALTLTWELTPTVFMGTLRQHCDIVIE